MTSFTNPSQMNDIPRDWFEQKIREAQIEAIKECAEVAKSEWVRWGEHMGHQVEKQSILKLIDQVK
jgi:hypothetical protein